MSYLVENQGVFKNRAHEIIIMSRCYICMEAFNQNESPGTLIILLLVGGARGVLEREMRC